MGDCNTNFDNLIKAFNNPDSDETKWALNLLQISYDKFKQIITQRNSLRFTPSQNMQFKDLICGDYSSLFGYLKNDEWYIQKLPVEGTLKLNWTIFINEMRIWVVTGGFQAPPPPSTHSQSPSRSPEAGQPIPYPEMNPLMSVRPVTYSDPKYMPFSHSV